VRERPTVVHIRVLRLTIGDGGRGTGFGVDRRTLDLGNAKVAKRELQDEDEKMASDILGVASHEWLGSYRKSRRFTSRLC
jgi:hypothetical protein